MVKNIALSLGAGLLAYAVSMVTVIPEAHALTQTECRGFNSMYDVCTTYEWDFESGNWEVKEIFFRLSKEPIVNH